MTRTPPTARISGLPGTAGRAVRSVRRRSATAADAYRRLGVPGVAVALAGRVPGRVLDLQWYHLLETIPPGDPTVPRWPETRAAGPDDLAALASVGNAEADDVRARLENGDLAYLAWDDDRAVAYVWFRAGSWTEDDTVFVLADDERWAYDSFVAPSARGRRIAPGLMAHALADLQQRGVRRVLSVIDHLNEASLRASRRYGGRPIGSFLTVAVPGAVVVRERRLADDRVGWSFHRGPGPIVRRPPGPSPVAARRE